MMLPDTREFLTACEYKNVNLEKALGDEIFMALHLIMRGCKNYMKHLKNYHDKQHHEGLSHCGLTSMLELRMYMLDDYDMVPSRVCKQNSFLYRYFLALMFFILVVFFWF